MLFTWLYQRCLQELSLALILHSIFYNFLLKGILISLENFYSRDIFGVVSQRGHDVGGHIQLGVVA